jgi:hypothetical protein
MLKTKPTLKEKPFVLEKTTLRSKNNDNNDDQDLDEIRETPLEHVIIPSIDINLDDFTTRKVIILKHYDVLHCI